MVEDHNDNDIIQIIPGGGWQAVFAEKDEGTGEPIARSYPVVCWALTRGGSVRPMRPDPAGHVEFADEAPNFIHIYYSDQAGHHVLHLDHLAREHIEQSGEAKGGGE